MAKVLLQEGGAQQQHGRLVHRPPAAAEGTAACAAADAGCSPGGGQDVRCGGRAARGGRGGAERGMPQRRPSAEQRLERSSTALEPGQVLLLENLRFHPGETKPESQPDFAESLARLGDWFVRDACGTARRANASMVAPASHPSNGCTRTSRSRATSAFAGCSRWWRLRCGRGSSCSCASRRRSSLHERHASAAMPTGVSGRSLELGARGHRQLRAHLRGHWLQRVPA